MLPPPGISIHSDFPGDPASAILREICRQGSYACIYVSQFARFGKSGASLFLLYFSDRPSGLPYLLKISELKDARREFEAIHLLSNHIRDCRLRNDKIFESGLYGGLLYEHRGTDRAGPDAQQPVSLRELLWRIRGIPCRDKLPASFPHTFSTETLLKTVRAVYKKLSPAHVPIETAVVAPKAQYRRYLRRNRSASRLRAILGCDANKRQLTFLASEIVNPLWMIDNLPQRVNLLIGHIHGDLHPDNVIIDESINPQLIDFAWGAVSDINLDYVLLENSIRFWHFPRRANPDDQRRVDECLLSWDGHKDILSLPFSSAEAASLYGRLAALIGSIRNAAASAGGGESASLAIRYLFTQFVVLYGLMAFDEYDSYVTTRALGLMARCLSAPRNLKELAG